MNTLEEQSNGLQYFKWIWLGKLWGKWLGGSGFDLEEGQDTQEIKLILFW